MRNKALYSCLCMVVCIAGHSQPKPLLTRTQQAVLLEQAGSFYYVVRYATVDLDSSIIVASRSLRISLLPLMTEAISGEIPATLSDWVAKDDPEAAKRQLPGLTGKALLQQFYLLGSWYAFQSTVHTDRMDSALHYLFKARTEAVETDTGLWARRSACLLGKAFLAKNDTLSGNAWLRQAIGECRLAGDPGGEAMAWRYWGVYLPLLPALAPERIAYLKKAGALYLARPDDPNRINVLMHTGFQCFSIGRLADAQENFEAALRLEDSLRWPYAHYTTDVLALSAQTRSRYDEMLRYALRSVRTADSTRDSLCLPTFYLRLAEIYKGVPMFSIEYIKWSKKAVDRLLLSDFGLSVYQYAWSLCAGMEESGDGDQVPPLINDIHRRHPPANIIDSLYDHLLFCQYADYTHDTAAEMKYALLACSESKKVEAIRPFMQGQGDFFLAYARFHCGDYQQAEPLFRTFLTTPDARFMPQNAQIAYWALLHIDTLAGHFVAAASDYHQFWILDSSAFSATQARQVELLKVQYEVDEKEKNILLLQTQTGLQEHQLRQAAFVRGFSIGGIVLLFIISALLYNRYRLKQRSNRLLQLQKKEIDHKNAQLQTLVDEKEDLLVIKDWLMRELNHRMGNNLHFMMSLQSMQANSLSSSEALNAITQSNNRLYAMSLIHQRLTQRDGQGSIKMVQYIGDLVQHLSDALSPNHEITMETHIARVELDASQAIPVGLILNEAITNACKYAFNGVLPGSGATRRPRIDVSLQILGNDELEVVIKDNGKGYFPSIEQDKPSSLGFLLMEMLTTQLRGVLNIVNEDGLTIRLRFPVQKQKSPVFL